MTNEMFITTMSLTSILLLENMEQIESDTRRLLLYPCGAINDVRRDRVTLKGTFVYFDSVYI